MSYIKKINVGGTEYDILPPGGTEGQVLSIVNGQPTWTDNDDGWGTF